MTTIGIVLGGTRPNRNGPPVARWAPDSASRRGNATPPALNTLLDQAVAWSTALAPPRAGSPATVARNPRREG